MTSPSVVEVILRATSQENGQSMARFKVISTKIVGKMCPDSDP